MLALNFDTSELDRAFERMAEFPKLIEKAVVGAMTETVHDIHAAQIQEMKLSFENPTPWLQKGLIKALPYGKDSQFGGRRGGQTLAQSGTYFEEFPQSGSQNDVIRPHVKGGPRRKKRSERRLGPWLNGGYTLMASDYPKNAYGNIPGSVYSRMLADLDTIPTARAAKKREGKQAQFFIMRREDGQEYIAERVGDDIRPVLIFTNKTPNYKVRYNFHGVGKNQLAYSLPRHFSRIINRYLSRM
jgi:hypothetical protein